MYIVEGVKDDLNECVFKVLNRSGSSRTHEIVYDKNLDFASYSYVKFESEGLSCKHILAYLINIRENYLSTKYIPLRWTKDANDSDKSLIFRWIKLHQLASYVINKVVTNKDACSFFTTSLENVLKSVQILIKSNSSGHVSRRRYSGKANNEINLQKLLQVRIKECEKRLKGSKEKNTTKGRCCHGCRKVGQSHDKKNCPLLNKRND